MARSSLTIVADENVSTHAVTLLEVFDRQNEIRHLTQYFAEGTRDQEWIAGLANHDPKPIVLGGDGRILKRPNELQALQKSGLSFVILAPGWTNLAWEDFAPKLLIVWPKIVRELNHLRHPTIIKIPINSKKIEIIRP